MNFNRPVFPKRNNKNQNLPIQSTNSEFQPKDFYIPIIVALVIVICNQLFFEQNKKTELTIEFQKENLRLQTPILNRILSFTYKYELTTIIFVTKAVTTNHYQDTIKSKVLKSEKNVEETDSIFITVPSFIALENKRNRLIEDIEIIRKQRDFLDHRIYILFDKLLDFLDKHPLPNIDDKEEMLKTDWQKPEIEDEWHKLLSKLRTSCAEKLIQFGNYDICCDDE